MLALPIFHDFIGDVNHGKTHAIRVSLKFVKSVFFIIVMNKKMHMFEIILEREAGCDQLSNFSIKFEIC